MSTVPLPTYEDVIAYLVEHGQPAMANLVERSRANGEQARRSAEQILQKYYAIKAKYEPTPYRDHGPTWTGD